MKSNFFDKVMEASLDINEKIAKEAQKKVSEIEKSAENSAKKAGTTLSDKSNSEIQSAKNKANNSHRNAQKMKNTYYDNKKKQEQKNNLQDENVQNTKNEKASITVTKFDICINMRMCSKKIELFLEIFGNTPVHDSTRELCSINDEYIKLCDEYDQNEESNDLVKLTEIRDDFEQLKGKYENLAHEFCENEKEILNYEIEELKKIYVV